MRFVETQDYVGEKAGIGVLNNDIVTRLLIIDTHEHVPYSVTMLSSMLTLANWALDNGCVLDDYGVVIPANGEVLV